MDINYLDIHITDTQDDSRELSLENASVDSIQLVYNGQEDKFANIITSELQFTFLVKDSAKDSFFHLYTGSETRYKVELIDISVIDSPKTIWTGYLLAEQFSEPYKQGNFFIDLIATDRIALLKNTDYAVAGNVSVLEVIRNCLYATGLEFPIWFADAVENSSGNVDYLNIDINTLSYVDDNEKTTAIYTVLEDVLKSIGCVLFAFNNNWYVIGLNRLKEKTITFKIYENDTEGVLTQTDYINHKRNIVTGKFIEGQLMGALSPLKKHTVTWQPDFEEILIPEDVVTAWPVNIETDGFDRASKYWEVINVVDSGFVVGVYTYLGPVIWSLETGFKTQNLRSSLVGEYEELTGPYLGVFASSVNRLDVVSNMFDHFVRLKDSIYFSGGGSASLDIEFEIDVADDDVDDVRYFFGFSGDVSGVSDNGSGKSRILSSTHGLNTGDIIVISETDSYNGIFVVDVIGINYFDIDIDYVAYEVGGFNLAAFYNNFFYAIERKDYKDQLDSLAEIIVSNAPTTSSVVNVNNYYSISFDGKKIEGKLSLDDVSLDNEGWYSVRIYPNVELLSSEGVVVNDPVVYKKIEFTLSDTDEKEEVLIRDIDYTTSGDLEVFHSSSATTLSTKSFVFSDLYTDSIFKTEDFEGYFEFNAVTVTVALFTVAVDVDASIYARLLEGYKLFVLKVGASILQEVVSANYTLEISENGVYRIVSNSNAQSGVFVQETDRLFLEIQDYGVEKQSKEYWLDRFKRYDVEEALPMYKVLNRMYHDLLFEYNFTSTGTFLGLVSPLELMDYPFNGERLFYPLKVAMNLHQNTTELTMVESKNSEVKDYE